MLHAFRQEESENGVFGDIAFNPHREWIEKVCKAADITPHLPSWGESQDKIMKDFIDLGVEVVVVAARSDFFGEEILGQKVDPDFIGQLEKLSKTKKSTPCGLGDNGFLQGVR